MTRFRHRAIRPNTFSRFKVGYLDIIKLVCQFFIYEKFLVIHAPVDKGTISPTVSVDFAGISYFMVASFHSVTELASLGILFQTKYLMFDFIVCRVQDECFF